MRADGDSSFDSFHKAVMTSAFRRFPSARRSMGVLCRVTDGPAHVVVHMAEAMHIEGPQTYIQPTPSQNQATHYMGVVGTPKSSTEGTRTHFTSSSFMDRELTYNGGTGEAVENCVFPHSVKA